MHRKFANDAQSYNIRCKALTLIYSLSFWFRSIQRVNFNLKAKTEIPCFESLMERNNMWEAQLKITSFLSSNHWMQAVVNWAQLRFSSAASNHRAQLHQLSSRSRFVLFASHCQFAVTKCPKMSGFSNVSKICAFHFILEQNFMQQQPFMLISLGHWQQQQQGKRNPFASQKNAAAGSLYVLQSTSQRKLSLARSKISVTVSIHKYVRGQIVGWNPVPTQWWFGSGLTLNSGNSPPLRCRVCAWVHFVEHFKEIIFATTTQDGTSGTNNWNSL